MPVVIECSACRGKMGIAEEHVGKPVRCPTCKHVFQAAAPAPAPAAALAAATAPAPKAAAPPSAPPPPKPAPAPKAAAPPPAPPKPAPAPTPNTVSLTCTGCRKKLQVKAALAGKSIKCPGCQTVLKVPAPTPADDDDWIDVNEAVDPPAEAVEAPVAAKTGRGPTGDWGKQILDEQELPEEMQDQLHGELSKTERVVWAARPRLDIQLHTARKFQMIAGPIFLLVSTVALGLTVFFIIKGLWIGVFMAAIFGAVFALGGVVALRAPGAVLRGARTRACYVVTNRRFLHHPGTGKQIFFGSSGGAAAVADAGRELNVVSWTGFELTRLVRTENKNPKFAGAGDLSFGRSLIEEAGGATLQGIDDVRGVEKMLREKLLHPLIDKILRGEQMTKEEKAQAKKAGGGEGQGDVVAADSNIKEYGGARRSAPEVNANDPNIKEASSAKRLKAFFEKELQKVPAEARREVEEELTAGEKILWIGRPEAGTKGRGFLGTVIGSAKRYEPDYYLYALTNRRILLFIRKKGPYSYYTPNIAEAGVEEDDRIPNGGGIVFRKVKRIITSTDKQGKKSTRVEMHYLGLLRIRDYKAVATLVYDTLIAPFRN